MNIKLRKWQQEAYEYFKKHPNCIVNAATGTGKTVHAIYIIHKLLERNPFTKILIVTPKNVIMEQTWLYDLHKFGIPISKIGMYNGNTKELSNITLVSIQSLHRLIETEVYDLFDCVIFDEIHNYGTKNYLRFINIPKKYKIGLSATIKRGDLKDISIRKAFNFNVYKYDIEDALKDEVLNPFDFFHISIEMDDSTREEYIKISEKIKKLFILIGDVDINKLDMENEKHRKLRMYLNERQKLITNYRKKAIVTKSIVRQNIDKKIIVFNQYNISSRSLYWDLLDTGVKVDIINSDLPGKTQTKVLNKFDSGEISVLLATTMLDEGYNLPEIEVAILMAQNSTEKQFIQRMGRVLRKKDTKSKVYYLTVKDTFEEDYFLDKKEKIQNISNKYIELVM